MRRVVVVLALLALALPMAAWADIITTNEFGTIAITAMTGTNGNGTIGASTISSHGSQLMQWNNVLGSTGHALGYVSYTTGTLASGTIAGGGMFNGGGSFLITGVGAWASALTGSACGSGCSLFTGGFNGPVTWTLVNTIKSEVYYTLSGAIQGTLYTGRLVNGTTVQNIYTAKGQLLNGIGHISMGGTTIVTPEPGTLGLLGTGLVAVAGMFRRKLSKG